MDYIDQIEKYVNGELKQTERKRFEERMKTNPRLAKDVRIFRELGGFMQHYSSKAENLNNTQESISKSAILNKCDDPDSFATLNRIREIKYYLEGKIEPVILKWLDAEAVYYPELIEEVFNDINLHDFDKESTALESKLNLHENLMAAYNNYLMIDEMVDEYLYEKATKSEDVQSKNEIEGAKIVMLPGIEKEKKSRAKNRKKTWYGIAATLALLVAAGTIIWLTVFNSTGHENLYDQYYQTLEIPLEMRGTELIGNNSFYTGMGFYNNKDYTSAIQQFSMVPELDQNYITAGFFKGLAEMETQQHALAIQNLLKVINGHSSNIKADARWYLALCYLKLGKIEETQKWLNEVIAAGPFYRDQALELKSKLE
jgi:tetratricopeptide (TPR) repeat protein